MTSTTGRTGLEDERPGEHRPEHARGDGPTGSGDDAPPGHVLPDTADTSRRISRLRLYNAVMGLLHLAQAVVILVIANDVALPVTAAYLQGPPGTGALAEPTTLYEARIAWGVAAFLLISALAHAVVAGPGFSRYAAGLRRGRNVFRWVEYSVSASVMVVLIAQLSGLSDAGALLAIFGVNAAMIFFGWLQEVHHQPGDGGWLPFILGCIAGAVPWVAIGAYLLQVGGSGTESPPTFVYAIFVSLFVLFNTFAVNQWLQYKRVGPWRDYLFGEAAYVLLSLVAKSALAWQVFGGTLAA